MNIMVIDDDNDDDDDDDDDDYYDYLKRFYPNFTYYVNE